MSSVVSRLPRGMRPLSRRLPLTVAIIVSTMMAIVLFQAFRRVDDLAAEVAVTHLRSSSQQLSTVLQGSATRLRRDIGQLSRAPAFERAASALATEADRSAAREVLAAELRRSAQVASVALWSREGRLVLAVGDTGLARLGPPRGTQLDGNGPDTSSATIEPLVARGDSIFIAVAGHVRDHAGRLQASIVELRHSSRNPASLELLQGLVGADARILLGNADENLWSDFATPVPVELTTADSSAGEHEAAGIRYLHSIERVPGTPWRVMVEVPRRWATARAEEVALQIGTLAVFMLLVGAGIVWLVINRSLRPLEEVMEGVGRLSKGDLGERVRVSADDEIGKLASAFNSMSERVEESSRQLASRAEALESANRDLHQSREQYRLLVDHLPDGILVQRAGLITFANARAAQLLGLEQTTALIGRSFDEFLEPAERGALPPAGREDAFCREIHTQRPDGQRLVMEATDIALDQNGQSATQTLLHDITQKQLLEEQLRQAQKMDAVGRLAGGVAHDFNNILMIIDAHAEFALNANEPEARRREDIGEIRKASAAAARLTRQLLAFSRKQALTPVELDLNTTLQGMLVMLARVIGKKIEVNADLTQPLWHVLADAGHLEQVIMNLAVNARDAMADGGRLDFRTGNLEIGRDFRTPAGELVPEGQYVMLAVEDSGAGIPEDVQKRVFEPFFTTKQIGQGTGLGLSTVYGIVKQSAGFIWLYSEQGKGTSFKILLPRSRGDTLQTPLARTNEHSIESLTARILLVEDQAAVRNALARALRNSGFVVHEAENAEVAEAILGSSDRVDLVVSDMMMPGKTGAELAVSPLVVNRDIPIVIMSGYSEEFTHRGWMLPANVVFLDKPVAPADLIRLISRLLS